MNVQFNGIVSGFSGLDEGEKYYVQDAVGTIGTTPGTYEILVGVALSPTQLMIQRGNRTASGSGSLGTATSNTVISTGFRPSIIRVTGKASDTTYMAQMEAVYSNGALSASYVQYNEGSGGEEGTSATVCSDACSNIMTLTITSITDYGFTITWTESNTFPGGAYSWEAEGHI
jgi:hypothetical protein